VTATGSPAPTFSETGALPAGVTLSSAGLLSGTPTGSGCGPTVYPIDLLATNGVGPGASQSFTLTVGASTAFAVCAPANLTATPGTPYSGTFTVANAGGVDQTGATKVTWSATGVPEGFKFKKGILEDTSGKKMVAGTYSVDVTAVENYKVESTATVNGKTKTVKTPETATASLTVTLVVS